MNGFNNNNNGWNTCNHNHNNNNNNSLNMQYFAAIDQQLKTLQQNTYLEGIRSNLSNLQNHVMTQGNNNNHIHHTGFVNHIHQTGFVTPGAPPLLNNYYGFPHHFNNNNNNDHNYHQYHQYHHGNGITPRGPLDNNIVGTTIPFGNNNLDINQYGNENLNDYASNPIPSITSSMQPVALSVSDRGNENEFKEDNNNDNNDNNINNNDINNNNNDINNNNNNINNNNNNEFDASKWAYKQAKAILKRYNLMILLNDKDIKTRMKEWFKTGNAFSKLNRMNQEVNNQNQLNEFLYNQQILINEQSSSSSSSDNDNGNDNHNDNERKDQFLGLSQQQNQQQRASINLTANTTHSFDANDPPSSSLHRYISSPELPSDTNDNRTVLTPQSQTILRRHQHNTNNFQSTSGSAPNNASFSNPIPDYFQWTQLNTEQSYVKISIFIFVCMHVCLSVCLVQHLY